MYRFNEGLCKKINITVYIINLTNSRISMIIYVYFKYIS